MTNVVYNKGKYRRLYNHIIKPLEKNVSIPMGTNTTYKPRDMLNLIICGSMSHGSLDGCYNDFIEAGREGLPSSDTVIYHISQKPWETVRSDFEMIVDMQVQELKDIGITGTGVYISCDIHDVPRYVKKSKRKRNRQDLKMVVRTEKARGTTYAHAIITVEIVHSKGCITIAFAPVHPLDDNAKLVKRLIQIVKSYGLKIKLLMMDREFYDSAVVNVLKEENILYLIPARNDSRIMDIRKKASSRYYYVEHDYNFGPEKDKAVTSLVVVDTTPLGRKGKDPYFVLITNTEIKNYTEALELARLYSFRWGIETGYRTIDDFMGFTCSLNYSVRLFLILIAVVLYNQWVLYKLLIQSKNQPFKRFGFEPPVHIIRLMFVFFLLYPG